MICVLDRGVIAEVGTHKELIARKGIYAKLYELQCGIVEEGEETSPNEVTDADAPASADAPTSADDD